MTEGKRYKPFSRSKKLAVGIITGTFVLAAYCANRGLGDAVGMVFMSGIPAGVALYVGKLYTDQKWGETENNMKEIN